MLKKHGVLAFGVIAMLVAPGWGQEAAVAPATRPAIVATHKTVKVLAIGNSFSEDSTAYLHDLVGAAGGKLVLAQAYIPGCPLDVHLAHAKAYEADPTSKEGSPYDLRFAKDVGGTAGEKASLKQLLTMADWEFVTIQQASIKSFDASTFEPYGKELAAYIHKYAPKAKIVVHETWAYRVDDPLFTKEKKLTRQEMYGRLHADYAQLAKDVRAVGIIPVGTAYEHALLDPRWVFTPPMQVDAAAYAPPELPPQKNSLNVGYFWGKGSSTQPAKLEYDGHHSSQFGRYLGACCWYEFFYGDVRGNPTVPKGGTAEEAAVLQEVAHGTVGEHAGS